MFCFFSKSMHLSCHCCTYEHLEKLIKRPKLNLHKNCVMYFHIDYPGKPTWKLNFNLVVKDVRIKGKYKVDKNKPSKSKTLDEKVGLGWDAFPYENAFT